MDKSLLLTRSSQFCCSLASLFSVYSSLIPPTDVVKIAWHCRYSWRNIDSCIEQTGSGQVGSLIRTIFAFGAQVASAVYEVNSNLVGAHLPLLLTAHARSLEEGGRWNICRTACRSAH